MVFLMCMLHIMELDIVFTSKFDFEIGWQKKYRHDKYSKKYNQNMSSYEVD